MKAVEPPIAPRADAHASAAAAGPRQAPRVAVRGWGAATALGDLAATWSGLLSGRFISDHARCHVNAPPTDSRVLSLARDVVEQLGPCALDEDAAVVIGTSKGSVEQWLSARVSPAGLADIADAVARLVRTRGPRLTLSAACASGLHALVRGAMMIRAAEARQVLVVAAEASVHPLFLGSFQRLGVLASPGGGCRPFDQNRTGFYMCEAAAAVLLEADLDDGADRSAALYLDGFALGGDATHLTGGDGELRTLRHLLSRVVADRPVDFIHAHGTGTPANDAAELAAIDSVLPDGADKPSVYSHKGALGHSLGAAGLLSVVLNCQAHATGTIPPNIQTRDPLPTRRASISRGVIRRPVRRSIAIAAGFGGATGVVALSGS